MSKSERIGGCLWKLFQVGLVVALLGSALLFVLREEKDEEELAEHETELVERESGDAEGGLVATVINFLKGNKEKPKLPPGAGSLSSGSGSRALKIAQEENAKGHIDLEELLKRAKEMRRDVDLLAEGTTQVDQTVLWQVIGDDIYYRIILTPYDRPAHQLMLDPNEAIFISFVSEDGMRVAPKAAAHRIETRTLRVATKEGYAAGWFADGKVSLEGQSGDLVELARVGWIFSGPLHARLRQIQRPDRGKDGGKDPFGVDTGVE